MHQMQIGDKEAQPGSPGQPVEGCLHGADFCFISPVGFAVFFKVLHLLGVLLFLILSVVLANIITHYPRV
jgi:hypothetical protein